ncbi:NAD-dependent epimerase/dehydratase family protein [Kribbella sp. NBC_01505]|uniref:NAD-dependent epimerase/dehydratase family protein n=1 Tax=Kribbella sp. NBC_01505 TaxID=2903580 RepID=UPI00386BB973
MRRKAARDGKGELLVTGAAGFVGCHLVRAAAFEGWQVTAVDLRPLPADAGPVTRELRSDFAAPQVLSLVRDGRFVAVLHQAAITNTLETDVDRLHSTNVTKAVQLARVCADAGTVFVYASSHSVYGRIHRHAAVPESAADDSLICTGPLNPYGWSKLQLDRLVPEIAPGRFNWAGLRYTNVFGAGEGSKGAMASIISQLVQGAAADGAVRLFADTLTASRDYVPVEHVVDCLLRILRDPIPVGVYNLGSGHAVSFAKLLEWCSEFRAGKELTVRLSANPIPDRYQYWTCADMAALNKALGISHLGLDVVHAAAEALYHDAPRGAT